MSELLDEWKGVWQHRTRAVDPKDPRVLCVSMGTHHSQGDALEALLIHYPFIVYLGFLLWRKMLVMAYPQKTSGAVYEFPQGSLPPLNAAVETDAQHLGVLGLLSRFTREMLPALCLSHRTYPLSLANTSPKHHDDISDFIKAVLLCDQVDVLNVLVTDLQLSLTDEWSFKAEPNNLTGTVLHNAARVAPTTKSMKLLMKRGASAELKNTTTGCIPLHHAATYGHKETVRVLIQVGGCSPDAKAGDGCSGLYSAAQNGHPGGIEALLENGADIRLLNLGWPALHAAVEKDHHEAMLTLLRLGAPIDLTNKNQATAMHTASVKDEESESSLRTLTLLLENGADPNVQDARSFTPLHNASSCGTLETCKMLLKVGVDPTCRTVDGFTPLHIAASQKHSEVVKLLLADPRVDAKARSNNGKTALDLVPPSRRDIAKLLEKS